MTDHTSTGQQQEDNNSIKEQQQRPKESQSQPQQHEENNNSEQIDQQKEQAQVQVQQEQKQQTTQQQEQQNTTTNGQQKQHKQEETKENLQLTNQQSQKQKKTSFQSQPGDLKPPQLQKQQSSSHKMNDFDTVSTLGNGAFGEVIHVKLKNKELHYALKIVDKKFLKRENKEYQVYMERGVLMSLSHIGIPKLNFSFQDRYNLYFGLDYIEGGDFASFLKLNYKNLIKSTIQFYIAELVLILEYIHSKGIVHRDIKPENLMLTQDRHLKIIDFGTASVYSSQLAPPKVQQAVQQAQQRKDNYKDPYGDDQVRERKTTLVGTAEYVSPELLEEDECSYPADLWAVGIILYKMYNGKTPFYEQSEYLIFEKIKENNFKIPEKMDEDAKDLLLSLLQKKPSERLGFGPNGYKDLKNHKYFKGILWDRIFDQEAPEREIFSPVRSNNHLDLQEYNILYGADNTQQPYSPFLFPATPQQKQQSQKQSFQQQQTPKQLNQQDNKIIKQGKLSKKVKSWAWVYHDKQVLLCSNPPKLVYIDVNKNDLKGEVQITENSEIKIQDNVKMVIKNEFGTFKFQQMDSKNNVIANNDIKSWVKAVKDLQKEFYQLQSTPKFQKSNSKPSSQTQIPQQQQ